MILLVIQIFGLAGMTPCSGQARTDYATPPVRRRQLSSVARLHPDDDSIRQNFSVQQYHLIRKLRQFHFIADVGHETPKICDSEIVIRKRFTAHINHP
jgi:hypothetical protein